MYLQETKKYLSGKAEKFQRLKRTFADRSLREITVKYRVVAKKTENLSNGDLFSQSISKKFQNR